MEQERFEIEIVPLRPRLLQIARWLLADDSCEDVVQETMMKLWLMRHKLDEYRSVSALATVIVRHLCYNILSRERDTTVELNDETVLSLGVSPENEVIAREEEERLLRVIALLPDLQQAVLRMKHIDGLEVAEIARITGSSAESVRVNLSRARKRVKELFIK